MASPAIGTGTGNVQTNSSTSTASFSIDTPTNAASGDLLIMVIATGATKTQAASGWTSVATVHNSGSNFEIECWRRLHDGSSSSYTTTWTGNTSAVGTIARVTGADTSSPIDVSATYDSATTSSTAHTAPSVTTTVADTLLINAYTTNAARTWTPASSQTEVSDVNPGSSLGAEVTKLDVAATGATGDKTSTCSSTCRWASISVAIKPAPSLIKSIGSVPIASVKKVSGVAIASAKKVAGVANT